MIMTSLGHNCTLANGKFRCLDGSQCLNLDKVCNDVNDCQDSSDEHEMCQTTCKDTPCNGRKCISHPHGPTCLCDKGFRTSDCEDINECEDDRICPHTCTNSVGSYKCSCWAGFDYHADKEACIANKEHTSFLYYSTKDAVWRHNLTDGTQEKVMEHNGHVFAISADDTFLYWSEGGTRPTVSRMRMTNSSSKEVISLRTVGSPEGLAVDWWTGNVYYTDHNMHRIVVLGNARYKSYAFEIMLMEKPRGIALHPESGTMYWTDLGRYPAIWSAFMSGLEAKALVGDKLHWPSGLTIDQPSERLYWVDSGLHVLESIRLSGDKRRTFTLHGAASFPFNVQVMDSSLFWTTREKDRLFSAGKVSGSDSKVLRSAEGLISIYAHHSLIHTVPEDDRNPCKINPCPYMCLLSGRGRRVCVDGKSQKITRDAYSPHNLMVGYGNKIFRVEFKEQPHSVPVASNFYNMRLGNMTVSRLAYSPQSGVVVIADNAQKKLLKVTPHGLNHISEIATEPIGYVSSMVMHPWVDNLWWTDSERRTVEVFSLATNYQQTRLRLSKEYIPLAVNFAGDKHIFILTRNTTQLTMIHMIDGRIFKSPLQATILESESVSMSVVKEQSLVFLMISDRLISWNYDREEEAIVDSNFFSPPAIHMAYESVIGTFYWSSSDGTIYWGKDKLLKMADVVGNETIAVPQEMPLLVYQIKAETDQLGCMPGNGGCTDICNPIIEGFIDNSFEAAISQNCSCGNKRRLSRLLVPQWTNIQLRSPYSLSGPTSKCIPYTTCEFRCASGECLSKVEVCDGLANCEMGEDEYNCLGTHPQDQFRGQSTKTGADSSQHVGLLTIFFIVTLLVVAGFVVRRYHGNIMCVREFTLLSYCFINVFLYLQFEIPDDQT